MGLSFTSEMQITLPEYLVGTNRFQNINKIISYNLTWKNEAFDHLKNLLSNMRDLEASDMDFGGFGARGKVWYRVFGRKSPDPDMPSYTEDEVVAILLSILSISFLTSTLILVLS